MDIKNRASLNSNENKNYSQQKNDSHLQELVKETQLVISDLLSENEEIDVLKRDIRLLKKENYELKKSIKKN